ncbi:nuclear fragile X mental retardation-interacting protein 1 [Purpureocillium lilacinum]|uniref:Nuclear fragile X mental retardation-interacting protein 1 n=1 Tax=Purpureocillium lilacinum TaxID=33203 RepID=A0A179HCV5_PURLI|nr:nuclear fragile X mental retardation-interacting protein 1 [Purpureocillium lilacinum]OAQ87313.1 nuclear fragile X mental retardation-interacting protein 1 [Purpureocillium lilacinum]OAQ95264.1 nuclear fragile X mental retardation-interacting protein 1 [Purpureocillium lilacinum]
MSGYGYAPPPPPPSASGGHPGYGQPTPSYAHHRGGGASGGRGRGGQYSRGRGDYQAAGAAVPTHYEYPPQPYSAHGMTAYGAPSAAANYHQPHPQQWAPEHGHAPAPQNAHHPHAPSPISPSNYHPNYAPQSYAPTQYSQQPAYGAPQQYGHPGITLTTEVEAVTVTVVSLSIRIWGHRFGRATTTSRWRQFTASHIHMILALPTIPQPNTLTRAHRLLLRLFIARKAITVVSTIVVAEVEDIETGFAGVVNHQNHQNHGNDAKVKVESQSAGKKKKRKTNTLGLTPGMESESEDDEGEEKALLDLIGAETLQISDVAAFLAERRKNFPTRARVEAKKAAEVARKDEDKAASLEKQADKLRKQLRKVESSIKRKREQGDEGDEMRDVSPDSSDDEKPEVMSSRTESAAPPPPPPAKKADVSKHCKYYATGGTCGKKGKCRFVHDPEVREAAMKEREANDGRMTIQQRLILNDKEQEDLTILQSIQYLREKGAMKAVPKGQGGADAMDVDVKEEKDKNKKPNGSSLLPAAPASLPEPPIKKEANSSRRNPQPPALPSAKVVSSQGAEHYQGWLLQPYGSGNGKASGSDDLP